MPQISIAPDGKSISASAALYTGSWESPALTVDENGNDISLEMAPSGFTPDHQFIIRLHRSDDNGQTWRELYHAGTVGTQDGSGGLFGEPFSVSLVPAPPGKTYLVKWHMDVIGQLQTSLLGSIRTASGLVADKR